MCAVIIFPSLYWEQEECHVIMSYSWQTRETKSSWWKFPCVCSLSEGTPFCSWRYFSFFFQFFPHWIIQYTQCCAFASLHLNKLLLDKKKRAKKWIKEKTLSKSWKCICIDLPNFSFRAVWLSYFLSYMDMETITRVEIRVANMYWWFIMFSPARNTETFFFLIAYGEKLGVSLKPCKCDRGCDVSFKTEMWLSIMCI